MLTLRLSTSHWKMVIIWGVRGADLVTWPLVTLILKSSVTCLGEQSDGDTKGPGSGVDSGVGGSTGETSFTLICFALLGPHPAAEWSMPQLRSVSTMNLERGMHDELIGARSITSPSWFKCLMELIVFSLNCRFKVKAHCNRSCRSGLFTSPCAR